MTTKYIPNRVACFAIACFLLTCVSGANSQEMSLEMLLERIIIAYGGEENLRKLDSHIQEWDVIALSRGYHGTDTRRIRVPGQLKVEVTYPHRKETRVISGESGYVRYSEESARVATQPQKDAMRLQLMRHYSPRVLREKIESLTLETQGDFRVITLFEQGVRVDYFVNVNSWHIEKVLGSLAMNGFEMQFLTEYSEFALRDGVLVHMKENKFAGGVNTAVLQLRRITLDANLAESDFSPIYEGVTSPGKARDDVT